MALFQKAAQLASDFNLIASYVRHGKYAEINDALSQPDWELPIDYQDDKGNTLLHIACQNGMKKLVKLFLRSHANINSQNANGQTPLHFACAYEHEELARYLIEKGADDSILNADGLTCYEGLSREDLENI